MKYRTVRDAATKQPELLQIKQSPEGRNLCRFCSAEVFPPRRTLCSAECAHEWMIRTNIRYARRCVRKRDKNICANCKIDCAALRKMLNALPTSERYEKAEKLGIPKHRAFSGSLWDLDHIIPVWENGGICGLDNMQILCCKCHAEKSAKEATQRAILKKENLK